MGLPADMGWYAEGPSAYPKHKAMFEKWKARMESEIENVNRAPDSLSSKCRCYDSRDGHAVAFRRQVAQSALGSITAACPEWVPVQDELWESWRLDTARKPPSE